MIFEVKIANFYSIRSEITINFRAAKLNSQAANDLKENIFIENNEKMLKSITIYGANASGKSNIFKAFALCINMILNPNVSEDDSFKYIPFKKDYLYNRPSSFFIHFMHDKIEYEYYFEFNKNKILRESLYYYPNGRITKIFERDETLYQPNRDKYKFGNQISRPFDVAEKTASKVLFLTTAKEMGREVALKLFNYFKYNYIFRELQNHDYTNLFSKYKMDLIYALKIMDIKINDIEYDYLQDESDGTNLLINTMLLILDTIKNNKILLIDEIEKSLHPNIVDFLIKILHSSNKAQFVFTSHSVNLLSFNNFRKDQVYFCTKMIDDSTYFYPLTDFKEFRDTLDLSKAYLQGRFNAVPKIKYSKTDIRKLVKK